MNPAAEQTRSLADQLASARVGLREDLEVSRHLFRGEPCYIVRDPVTFQTQRLEPADYQLLVLIEHNRTLGEIFEELVDSGRAEPADQESFYQFVMDLHRLGFLRLPVADHRLLYRRHMIKQQAQRRQKLNSLFYLQIPLVNPDGFLDRTVRLVRPLFSRWAFAAWLMLVITAIGIGVQRWSELKEPLQGLLVAENLPLMWLTLIVLKIFHEFGHAYACKNYGGNVPEMGVSLILMTPCAYVDATASWGFSRRRERLVVALGGMYFEIAIAALATFVWAFTRPSLLNSLAYNVIFLAGLVTVLFNINPLMRFDGYYILSDLVEVPNLRSRSSAYVRDRLKQWFLGIAPKHRPASRRLRGILLGFGFASSIYRVMLMLTISAVLATKFFLLGVSLAVIYVGGTVFKTLAAVVSYLWHAEETAHVRVRAVALALLLMVFLPAALVFVPVPARVKAEGVLAGENETVVRAETPGFVDSVGVRPGSRVVAGELLVALSNQDLIAAAATARANLEGVEVLRESFRSRDPSRVAQEEERAEAHRKALSRAEEKLAQLQVRATLTGRVVDGLEEDTAGIFLAEGDPVATIISGGWQLRVVLDEQQFRSADPRPGQQVRLRASADPSTELMGRVLRVAPAGSRGFELEALTRWAGGAIEVDPVTGEAAQPYFAVWIAVDPGQADFLRHGMRGVAVFPAPAEPIAVTFARGVHRFLAKLMQD